MVSILFFVAAAVGAFHTLLALFAPRRPLFASFGLFFGGWIAGDLALFHIGWQAVATAVFVALGALDAALGVAGLVITFVSWLGLAVAQRWHRQAASAMEDALVAALGADYRDVIPDDRRRLLREDVPRSELLRPFRPKRSASVTVERGVSYGQHRRQRLDIVKPASPTAGAPVLLQVHGGGWVSGQKSQQGQPLMFHLAAREWVCVAMNYRLAPKVRLPDQITDVKRAIAWIRANVATHGGDPNFVAVSGGSAGGHLTALAALSANDAQFQPGFADVDTSLVAAVPMYGAYDLGGRGGVNGDEATRIFLEQAVIRTKLADDPHGWDAISPLARVRADAPPFCVVHGSDDSLVWVEGARNFAAALSDASDQPVVYAEIPHAQHAFDVLNTHRTMLTVQGITRFLEWVRATSGHSIPATDESSRSRA